MGGFTPKSPHTNPDEPYLKGKMGEAIAAVVGTEEVQHLRFQIVPATAGAPRTSYCGLVAQPLTDTGWWRRPLVIRQAHLQYLNYSMMG